ncbi:hypothetical protein [Enterococcus rivorum]|uniref:DUF5082 domain-containing protein n=1 Tax=Enterococcus rivorum TaxID=762845 RepID=A0A1E5KV80_9ENTE|nr:hypothetical protein [Enterococcus rivorum]MBP2100204.1 hypothetical protein [Enterococcus rivorum]OEH81785.1 hypothetical protein BCR26_03230 [Enterococcus rivorum]
MKKSLLKFFLIMPVLFLFVACSPDKSTSTVNYDTKSGASVTESTGKWVQKELDTVAQQMSDSSMPATIKTTWDDLSSVISTDMKKEQISDQLRSGLKGFQTDLETEIANASGDVKTQLETIKTEIDGILAKVN